MARRPLTHPADLHLADLQAYQSQRVAHDGVTATTVNRVLGYVLTALREQAEAGTFPNEVIEVIWAWNVPTLKGNYDQGVGNKTVMTRLCYTNPMAEALGKRSIAWTNEHTTEENKAFLRQLLKQIPLQLGDLRMMSSLLINLHNIIGAVTGSVYNFIRHPQYASLIVSSFGMLLLMGIFRRRFINR